jgi:pimeloyl-ACP methyl ester carboxylesterase
VRERGRFHGWRAAAAFATLLAALPAAAAPGVALSPCTLAHPISPIRVAARCGTLAVPEDRARPDGRKILLAIAVVPAEAPRPAPDPVFVLAGGPGQAIRELFPILAPSFARTAGHRDVVLVDQRGTGGSGRLACPSLDAPERVLADPAAELRAVAECARSLRADLSRYGTADFVADLEAVRAALGYERVNAIGFSYGTRAALAWLKAHPDRIRSLVLDGVLAQQYAVGATAEQDGQRALDLLAGRCVGDPPCAAKLGAPGDDLRALRDRLAAAPERVRTRHPLTGAPIESAFGVDQLRAVVSAFLYQSETAAVLPVMLHAAVKGDLGPLAAQGVAATADLEAGLSRPLQLSVLCAEDAPFVDGGSPGMDAGLFLGRSVRQALRAVCAAWPVGPAPGAARAPFRSDVPALLLGGEADPVTPPRWAELLARDLPNARQIVLAGQGHGVFGRGCVPRLVAEFLDAGGAAGLDLSCARAIRPPPVFIDLRGGSP